MGVIKFVSENNLQTVVFNKKKYKTCHLGEKYLKG